MTTVIYGVLSVSRYTSYTSTEDITPESEGGTGSKEKKKISAGYE
jgi:hypothetical protein